MELNDYQDKRSEFSIYSKESNGIEKPPIERLTYAVLALCGESGELANKLKKNLRGNTQPDPDVLADELGDVLWYVAAVAYELGMPLEAVAEMNLQKLSSRRAADRK